MMSTTTEPDLANRHLQSVQKNVASDEELDTRPKDYQAFRVDAQVKPSNAMLDLWFKDGNQRAMSYNHLYDVEFNPSEGMVLTFSQHRVTIEGHLLDDLYRALKRHRIVYIWEADSTEANLIEDDQPLVKELHVQDLSDGP